MSDPTCGAQPWITMPLSLVLSSNPSSTNQFCNSLEFCPPLMAQRNGPFDASKPKASSINCKVLDYRHYRSKGILRSTGFACVASLSIRIHQLQICYLCSPCSIYLCRIAKLDQCTRLCFVLFSCIL